MMLVNFLPSILTGMQENMMYVVFLGNNQFIFTITDNGSLDVRLKCINNLVYLAGVCKHG